MFHRFLIEKAADFAVRPPLHFKLAAYPFRKLVGERIPSGLLPGFLRDPFLRYHTQIVNAALLVGGPILPVAQQASFALTGRPISDLAANFGEIQREKARREAMPHITPVRGGGNRFTSRGGRGAVPGLGSRGFGGGRGSGSGVMSGGTNRGRVQRARQVGSVRPIGGPRDLSQLPAPVAYTWNTKTAIFYRLVDGRISVFKKDGTLKTYWPQKHIVISRNPGVRDLMRADKRLDKLVAGLAKVQGYVKKGTGGGVSHKELAAAIAKK